MLPERERANFALLFTHTHATHARNSASGGGEDNVRASLGGEIDYGRKKRKRIVGETRADDDTQDVCMSGVFSVSSSSFESASSLMYNSNSGGSGNDNVMNYDHGKGSDNSNANNGNNANGNTNDHDRKKKKRHLHTLIPRISLISPKKLCVRTHTPTHTPTQANNKHIHMHTDSNNRQVNDRVCVYACVCGWYVCALMRADICVCVYVCLCASVWQKR